MGLVLKVNRDRPVRIERDLFFVLFARPIVETAGVGHKDAEGIPINKA